MGVSGTRPAFHVVDTARITAVLRGRYSRLNALLALGIASVVADWYADAFAWRTAPPTAWLGLPYMASFVLAGWGQSG